MAKWEVVIGLETHAQLSTAAKIFSGASTAFGAAPNTHASAVDIALPGVLPVLNKGAVERAIRFGLAVGGTINRRSVFARKNYFYPDLPKGYQISQYEIPVVQGGALTIRTKDAEKTVRLTRAHLEEDAGKSLHEDFHGMTGIDLNRAGTPLLEIVSEPDLRSAEEAVAYAKDAARACPLDRHLRRQHAGRQLPLRRQRLGAPARQRDSSARAARSRTSTASASCTRRSSSRCAGRSSSSRTAAPSCRRRGSTIPTAARRGRCEARKTRRTIATSLIPTCRHS